MPKNFFGTSYCLCAISYPREGKSPPDTSQLLTFFSHVPGLEPYGGTTADQKAAADCPAAAFDALALC